MLREVIATTIALKTDLFYGTGRCLCPPFREKWVSHRGCKLAGFRLASSF
jgi:hypothetical protein